MNILIVGSGAREHAITKALARSPKTPNIYCCSPRYNLGIASLTKQYKIVSLENSPHI
ncbi:MAG: phosphoribosylamine--glycine ligase family protein [bacterium]|nr:phosphoribosylamine--glycine ligase family protein [bacterium]